MLKSTALNLTDRQQSFAALGAETFDVLIIGAGITGCGIARDAAMRGLRTVLIDAGDIAAGTSSRSSKLIHGGLRYLAQGQVSVVREAANERRTLRRIAPHLSQTIPMVIPTSSKKATAGFRAVMWSYEKLGKVDKSERHEIWDLEQLQTEEPAVVKGKHNGAVVYPEYLTDDTRLTLANARSAAAHGALVVTYAAAEQLLMENGIATGAEIRSTLPGHNQQVLVQAKIVVNAAGPWVDIVRQMEDSKAKKKLQLTKGIHLVFSQKRLPVRRTIIWNAPDGRSIFAVRRGEFVYLGTTDTFYPQPNYRPEITREDINYLLDSANQIFDIEPLTTEDVVSLWSGLRPLLGSEGKSPSEISRRDEVMKGPGGVTAIAGGKLTSYRSMASRLVDLCEKQLGCKPTPALTEKEPLPGGDFKESLAELTAKVASLGLSPLEAERAARLYGSEALELFARDKGPAVEAAFAVTHEGALTLEDYWVRRSSRACFDQNGGMDTLEPAANAMADLLGWTGEERNRQIDVCRQQREEDLKLLKTPKGKI
ncbi:MAG: glycerol-3-phosphate dehydrogenase/oxidase [Deltaproteobacteria bacterium]|nr:glycerol-3-phosphate dehydrogenase/oxidase [Deltaproteobacteria bacterium]MBT6501471.1 glycerol-3-phosphate dehydrogenase/oxidase [Deltaproteobacteria bacterium]